MQIVILSGGLATRLGELTRKQPKSLVEFLGKPFIEYQIKLLKSQGIREIVLCIGHLGEKIQEYLGTGKDKGVEISYSVEETRLGTGGALKNAAALLHDEFLTIYGDSYLELDYNGLMSHFLSQNKLAMMTVLKNYNKREMSNTCVADGLVTKYSKTNVSDNMIYVDYGAHCFRKDVLKLMPENGFYPLEKLFPELVQRQELFAYEVYNRFYEIGSPEGIEDFKNHLTAMEVN